MPNILKKSKGKRKKEEKKFLKRNSIKFTINKTSHPYYLIKITTLQKKNVFIYKRASFKMNNLKYNCNLTETKCIIDFFKLMC